MAVSGEVAVGSEVFVKPVAGAPEPPGELPQRGVSVPFGEGRTARERDPPAFGLGDGNLGALFPGVVGYEDTVVPQMVHAILSGHDTLLLGLRGAGEDPHAAGDGGAAGRVGSR